MTAAAVPAFDPASPDADLLAAFQQIRASRNCIDTVMRLPGHDGEDEEINKADDLGIAAETAIYGDFATTVAGIIPRLQLALINTDASYWIDHALMRYGLLAAHARRDRLDGNGQQILLAAMELLHLDWSQALTAYETATKNYNLALLLKQHVEEEEFRGGATDTRLMQALVPLVDMFEDAFCDADQFEQFVRTLTPTHEALGKKLSIVAREGDPAFAMPWIARDVEFLAGLSVDDVNSGLALPEGAN